jgi:pyridoxamine 5'-phosphate oxidase
MDVARLRDEFYRKGLAESDLKPDPFGQFQDWYDVALAAQLHLADAMTLATATPDGRPSARMVLLRGADERGFVFFTNYESRKAVELAANPYAALVFHWKELERQVRIEGTVTVVSAAESDDYFQTRPAGSRISASVSPQSRVVSSREELERRSEELWKKHPQADVPRPSFWGGYRVIPTVIEFWQGRPNRLHDRFRYSRLADGDWRIERLAP